MSELFPNHAYGKRVLKHRELPIFITEEFDFFRCVTFEEKFYGKTISELHQGNLRDKNRWNRHSRLFPYQHVSYWADSPATARAEVKYHDHSNNLLTFWAYDDATSTYPTLPVDEPMVIIDGRLFEFHTILEKDEHDIPLNKWELEIIDRIVEEEPDCLAYESKRHRGGINFLFFEKGFRKLAVRQVRLRLGDRASDRTAIIGCASGSDYTPYLKGYGEYFMPIARTGFDRDYLLTKEYHLRRRIYEEG